MPTWLIWVVVIVVVVLIVAAIVWLTGKRRTEQRRKHAEELREEASTHAAVLPESERQAEELRAKADLARAEAARAEERAAGAEQGHRIEQASYEDKLREADRLDPEVDHRSGEYEPDVWNEESSESTTGADPTPTRETTAPRHATTPEDTTVAKRTEDPEADAAVTSGEKTRQTETSPTERRRDVT